MAEDRPLRLRDFVYLDVERVKSLYAQLERGLLSDWSDRSGSSKSVDAKGGVSVPGLAEIGGGGQYAWTNDSSETWTLHDFIYNEMEERLLELERLRKLPDDVTSARLLNEELRAGLSPVEYVLVRGRAEISDHAYLMRLLENFNEVARIVTEFSSQDKINEAAPGKDRESLVRERQQAVANAGIDEKYRKKLMTLFELFQKDRLVVKMVPFPDVASIRVVGAMQPELLRDRLDEIRFKFGSSPAEPWTMFCQVASLPPKVESRPDLDLDLTNQIEQALEVLFHSLRGIEDQFRVRYPEIAVTPIAIYRD